MTCSTYIVDTSCRCDELDMTQDGETDLFGIRNNSTVGIQVFTKNHSQLDDNCPEIILKVSLKKDAEFVTYDCQKICSDCPGKFWNIADAAFKYFKVCYKANGATDGTICICASAKRN